MTPKERQITEEELEILKLELNDPWRLLRWVEQGYDPAISEANTRQLESMIEELEGKLAAAT